MKAKRAAEMPTAPAGTCAGNARAAGLPKGFAKRFSGLAFFFIAEKLYPASKKWQE